MRLITCSTDVGWAAHAGAATTSNKKLVIADLRITSLVVVRERGLHLSLRQLENDVQCGDRIHWLALALRRLELDLLGGAHGLLILHFGRARRRNGESRFGVHADAGGDQRHATIFWGDEWQASAFS
jgi:hypothetical protein